MDLDTVRRILRRWGWLALIPTALGIAAGWMAAPSTPVYQATVRLAVGLAPGAAPAYDYDGYYRWLASEYLAAGVSAWIRSRDFAERVAAALAAEGVRLPAPAVQGALASDYQRSVVVLYVTAADPALAEAIARAATAVARREVHQVWPQAGQGTAWLTPLDPPAAAPAPPPLRARLEGPFRAALGLLAGLTLAFLAHALDPWIHERADVEGLGLPVVGEIPKAGAPVTPSALAAREVQ